MYETARRVHHAFNTFPLVKTRVGVNAQPPSKWKIVVFNDDSTPADFLLDIFTMVFNMTKTEAMNALYIRKYHGEVTVMVAPWEVAEEKASSARREVDAKGFLLKISTYPL